MKKTEVETRNFLHCGWTKCSDEPNHHPTDDMDIVIIAYYEPSDKRWYSWTYEDCPYGWNVLCDGQGYWMKESFPKYTYDETD